VLSFLLPYSLNPTLSKKSLCFLREEVLHVRLIDPTTLRTVGHALGYLGSYQKTSSPNLENRKGEGEINSRFHIPIPIVATTEHTVRRGA